jgi:hypothetical protein
MLVIPSTKQIASRMLDFPDPFKPVIALNDGSHPKSALVYDNSSHHPSANL